MFHLNEVIYKFYYNNFITFFNLIIIIITNVINENFNLLIIFLFYIIINNSFKTLHQIILCTSLHTLILGPYSSTLHKMKKPWPEKVILPALRNLIMYQGVPKTFISSISSLWPATPNSFLHLFLHFFPVSPSASLHKLYCQRTDLATR